NGSYRCPYGPLVISASNEVDLTTLKDRLKITPAVELDWDASRANTPNEYTEPTVTLEGKWRPGTSYAIEIAPGVADVFKQTDTAGLKGKVSFDDLNPALVTGGFLAVVEATQEAPKLPVEVSNLTSLDVKMWKLSIEE